MEYVRTDIPTIFIAMRYKYFSAEAMVGSVMTNTFSHKNLKKIPEHGEKMPVGYFPRWNDLQHYLQSLLEIDQLHCLRWCSVNTKTY